MRCPKCNGEMHLYSDGVWRCDDCRHSVDEER